MIRRSVPLFGAIADDLTGGAELASMLVARGVSTGLSIGVDTPLSPGHQAYVVALKTRVRPVDEAVAQVLAAAERLIGAGCRQIFFKYCATFDSTPAGNIGPCAEALMNRLGARVVPFCPQLIEVGLTLFQGRMFAGAHLLSETPKQFDPLTPMTNSNIVEVLAQQSRCAVGLLPFQVVDRGPEAISLALEALATAGRPLVVVDGVRERDLEAIAVSCANLPLLTGNSSIAAHLPTVWRKAERLGHEPLDGLPGVEGPALVLAGSVAGRTAQQLDYFEGAGLVIRLDLMKVFADPDLAEQAFEVARGALLKGRPVAVATTAGSKAVKAVQDAHGVAAAAAKAEEVLARLAVRLVKECAVRRLLVAGGETSGAVMRALDITELDVGPYLGPGLNRAVTKGDEPLAIVLKSGKLGPVDMFPSMLESLRRPQSALSPEAAWPPGDC